MCGGEPPQEWQQKPHKWQPQNPDGLRATEQRERRGRKPGGLHPPWPWIGRAFFSRLRMHVWMLHPAIHSKRPRLSSLTFYLIPCKQPKHPNMGLLISNMLRNESNFLVLLCVLDVAIEIIYHLRKLKWNVMKLGILYTSWSDQTSVWSYLQLFTKLLFSQMLMETMRCAMLMNSYQKKKIFYFHWKKNQFWIFNAQMQSFDGASQVPLCDTLFSRYPWKCCFVAHRRNCHTQKA